MLPGRQGPGRTRSLPGPQLDLVTPPHHARHARPRSRRRPRPAHRSPPPRPRQRPDPADRPRGPPPTRRRAHPTGRDSGQASALVCLAPTPPSNSPPQPLPTTVS
ncbi:hypothetical protein J2X68_008030 [Streptomyces sp. 3330]|nr:hypothetical protein [Streptomyces sp. 3330]